MGAFQISFTRGLAQGSEVILRLQSRRQVGAGGELASLPKKGAPLVRKGPSQGGCFEREAPTVRQEVGQTWMEGREEI